MPPTLVTYQEDLQHCSVPPTLACDFTDESQASNQHLSHCCFTVSCDRLATRGDAGPTKVSLILHFHLFARATLLISHRHSIRADRIVVNSLFVVRPFCHPRWCRTDKSFFNSSLPPILACNFTDESQTFNQSRSHCY